MVTFMSLPFEIREMIFKIHFETVEAITWQGPNKVHWMGFPHSRPSSSAQTLVLPPRLTYSTSLFAVSRAISRQAASHFFKERHFSFSDLEHLHLLSQSVFAPHLNNIRHLHIAMAGRHRLEALAHIKKNMQLTSLTVDFVLDSTDHLNPWATRMKEFITIPARLTDILGFEELLDLNRVQELYVHFRGHVQWYADSGMEGIAAMLKAHLEI